VKWTERALNDLAQLRLDADDRAAVAAAFNEIDKFLSVDPHDPRLEVVSNLGTVLRGPLGVDFWISDESSEVTVEAAWKLIEDRR
jgi:hypothetical protein